MRQREKLYWVGVVALSVVAALLVYFFNQNPINPDGILYLETAKAYQTGGFHAAFSIYPWPFYSVLLAYFPAFLLNNFFITAIIIFFLLNVRELGASDKVMCWAAVIILCYPVLNQLRHDVIRDTGYWAFLMAAVWVLLRYQSHPSFLKAQAFGGLMLCAFLFRIEAIVVWCFAPFFLGRVRAIFDNLFILFLLVFVLFLWKISNHSHHFSQLGRVDDLVNYVETVFQYFNDLPNFFAIFLKTLSPLYFLLIIFAVWKTPIRHATLWWGLVLINFLIPLLFYFHINIVDKRYVLACSLLLLLRAPFILPYIHRYFLALCIVVLGVMTVDGIVPFGYSKAYITEAGLWLKTNALPGSPIFSNSPQVLFYAGALPKDWQIPVTPDKIRVLLKKNERDKYNYLAIRVNDNERDLQKLVDGLPWRPVKVFANKRHDKVIIFYVAH